jgi:hypothetical protein
MPMLEVAAEQTGETAAALVAGAAVVIGAVAVAVLKPSPRRSGRQGWTRVG